MSDNTISGAFTAGSSNRLKIFLNISYISPYVGNRFENRLILKFPIELLFTAARSVLSAHRRCGFEKHP
jgi:hypothetical protein